MERDNVAVVGGGGRDVAAPSGRWPATVAAVAVPVVVGAVLAAARWTGRSPFGSDNDEYRLLADSVWAGSIRIAGVEGSKYPVGYAAALGLLDRLGLPLTGTALALNLVLVAVLGALVWWLVPSAAGLVGRSVACTALVVSLSLWASVVVVMPDLAFVVVVTAVVLVVGRVDRHRPPPPAALLALAALVGLACLLKSVGVLVGLALAVALLLTPAWRRWSWLPALVGLGVTGAQALWAGTEPEHTTGYARTFWLVDPFDASAGRDGVADLPGRVVERVDVFLADVAEAVVGPQHTGGWTWVLAGVAVATAVWAWPERRRFTVPFLALYSVFLAAWPYSSARFGLVLLPWAAVGAGWAAGALARRTHPAVAVAVAALVLVPATVDARAEARTRAAAEAAQIDRLEAGVAEADRWLADHVAPDEPLASLDYRELAYRTDRTFLPVPYTSDGDVLWSVTGGSGARWLVALRELYPSRQRVVDRLVATHPDQVRLEASFGPVDVYRIDP